MWLLLLASAFFGGSDDICDELEPSAIFDAYEHHAESGWYCVTNAESIRCECHKSCSTCCDGNNHCNECCDYDCEDFEKVPCEIGCTNFQADQGLRPGICRSEDMVCGNDASFATTDKLCKAGFPSGYRTWLNLELNKKEVTTSRWVSADADVRYFQSEFPFAVKQLPQFSRDQCFKLPGCGCIDYTSCGWCDDCGDGVGCALLGSSTDPANAADPGHLAEHGVTCKGKWTWAAAKCADTSCPLDCEKKVNACPQIRGSACQWCADAGGGGKPVKASTANVTCSKGTLINDYTKCAESKPIPALKSVMDSSLCTSSVANYACRRNVPECAPQESGSGSPTSASCMEACANVGKCMAKLGETCKTESAKAPREIFCPGLAGIDCGKKCPELQQAGDPSLEWSSGMTPIGIAGIVLGVTGPVGFIGFRVWKKMTGRR